MEIGSTHKKVVDKVKNKIIFVCLIILSAFLCIESNYTSTSRQNLDGNYEDGYYYKRYADDYEGYKDSYNSDRFNKMLSSECDEYIQNLYLAIYGSTTATRSSFYARGLDVDTTGFLIRAMVPNSFNSYYFSNENMSYLGGYYGECSWYATGRAQEIIDSLGIIFDWTFAGDGGEFFNNANASQFGRSSNPLEPKQGAIMVFQGGSHGHGHVQVIEKVNTDESGNIVSVDISEGGQALTNKFRYVSNVDVNTLGNARGWSGYRFVGYVYLDEPINLSMSSEV